jgi:hypothetical protein
MAPDVLLRKLNYIVPLDERIDYQILRDSIAPALRDFSEFVALFAAQLDDETTR